MMSPGYNKTGVKKIKDSYIKTKALIKQNSDIRFKQDNLNPAILSF